MPKTVFMTTAMIATITVSLMADTASGSLRRSVRSVSPSAKVFFTTRAMGQATRKKR